MQLQCRAARLHEQDPDWIQGLCDAGATHTSGHCCTAKRCHRCSSWRFYYIILYDTARRNNKLGQWRVAATASPKQPSAWCHRSLGGLRQSPSSGHRRPPAGNTIRERRGMPPGAHLSGCVAYVRLLRHNTYRFFSPFNQSGGVGLDLSAMRTATSRVSAVRAEVRPSEKGQVVGKVIAASGLCSRRGAVQLIREGRVRVRFICGCLCMHPCVRTPDSRYGQVNGAVVVDCGARVGATDTVDVDGKIVEVCECATVPKDNHAPIPTDAPRSFSCSRR